MDAKAPFVVFVGSGIEAQLAWNRLDAHGIKAEVLRASLEVLAPFCAAPGGAGTLQVVVHPSDSSMALAVLGPEAEEKAS